jgi:hypothetical protein
MKVNISLAFIASSLILFSGCKKDVHSSSVALSSSAKASVIGLSGFSFSLATSRAIAFDQGTGENCILSYDLSTSQMTLTVDNNYTTLQTAIPPLWTTTGLHMDNAATYFFTSSTVTNNFNEVGGDHIIALDYNGDNHMDCLLIYKPGNGAAGTGFIVQQTSTLGVWHQVANFTSGIGGYDLSSINDKIIAYDLGNNQKQSLICYRPGNGIVWVLQKQSSGAYAAVYKSTGGIGGFDVKGINDQIITMDYNPGIMYLVCYRPGLGYVWVLSHAANTTSWPATFTSRTGFAGALDMSQTQDRIVSFDANRSGRNDRLFCYRPGSGSPSGGGLAYVIYMSNTLFSVTVPGGDFPFYPMDATPTSSNNYVGDKIFGVGAGNTWGLSNLFCYQAGTQNVWIYAETESFLNNYVKVY